MATPRLAATWRQALKTALARPIAGGSIVAKVAVCSGIRRQAKDQPRMNMRPRIQ